MPSDTAVAQHYGPTVPYCDELHARKYRSKGETFQAAMTRVATALSDNDEHFEKFHDILLNMRFMPGGRIQAAIGSSKNVTASNCLGGETRVITREYGVVEICELEDKTATVLDGNGNWISAEFKCFGVQDLYEIAFANYREVSCRIRATLEHDWITDKGRVATADLKASGASVEFKKTPRWQTSIEGIRHGLVYGNGTRTATGFHIRICSNYEDIEPYFAGLPVSYPPSCNGDPIYYMYGKNTGGYDLKNLPDTQDLIHLLSFIRGWIGADGCVSIQPEVTLCCGSKEEEWLKKYAPLVGIYVVGSSELAKETNYGRRKKDSRNVRLDLRSIESSDILVEWKRERLTPTTRSFWRTVSVSDAPVATEPVYCAVVPTTHSFVLWNGLHSGNCYVLPVEDSFVDGENSIMQAAMNAAATMRMGGGVGYSFSNLRPRGDYIKKLDSQSSGPVSFMDIFDAVALCTASTAHRRGAQMAILDCSHPSIFEFIRAKRNEHKLTGFNTSVAVTDELMTAVMMDADFDLKFGGRVYQTIRARELWDEIMLSTWDYAEPGVVFIDQINRMNNLWYCETLKATNPCLAEGTLVSTPAGMIKIEHIIEGDTVATAIGSGKVTKIEKHEQQPVFRVELSDGTRLRATAGHIFHVARGKYFDTETRLDQLSVGDRVRLAPMLMPNNRTNNPFKTLADREYGLVVGAVIGDGCYTAVTRQVKVACGIAEMDWAEVLLKIFRKEGFSNINKSTESCVTVTSTEVKHALDRSPLKRGYSHEKSLPLELLNSNKEFLAGYIDGLISTDGNVHMSKDNPMVRVSSVSYESLLMLKRALSMFGILARIYTDTGHEPGAKHAIFGRMVTHTHQGYTLCILGSGLRVLADRIKLSNPAKAKRLRELILRYSLTGCTWAAEIKSIESDGVAAVYDLYEPETDTWVSDGVVNRGCAEQPLPPMGACLLGSFNLVKYVESGKFNFVNFENDIVPVVRAMDNVLDQALYPLPQQKEEALNKRRMGLGITGLANAAEALGLPYGSKEFLSFEGVVLKILANQCYRQSALLAKEKGAFPLYDKNEYLDGKFIQTLSTSTRNLIAQYGVRNSHLTSIAPTGTISLCADNVSGGIEPVFDHEFDVTVMEFDGPRKTTVQDYGARVFGVKGKRCSDVTVKEHIDVLTTAQKYIDSSCSKTVNISSDMSYEQFKDVYMQAWRGGAKGCSTFRLGGLRKGVLEQKSEPAQCKIDPLTGRKDCE